MNHNVTLISGLFPLFISYYFKTKKRRRFKESKKLRTYKLQLLQASFHSLLAARSSLLASHCKSQPARTYSLRKRLLYVQVKVICARVCCLISIFFILNVQNHTGLLPALVSSLQVRLLLMDFSHNLPLRLIEVPI